MKNSLLCLSLLAGLTGVACQDQREDEGATRIPAYEVPQAVRDAAMVRIPGLEIHWAEEHGDAYCVHGTVAGQARRVVIDPGDLKTTDYDDERDYRLHDEDDAEAR
ncbi:MAG: hypothetical protein EYC70_01310 [Planctomycetota bacterium]|nr:MAG: hypothetical protein EYC70_01310 [Planctomycetota bacterium]